jgi:phage replication-related protein YjqB (UPF0714/DUF867 family)
MVARHAQIRKALDAQEDLEDRREHCSIDARKLLEIGVDVGGQVRVMTAADDQVLFTVSESRDEDPDRVVRIGLLGRRRFGSDDEFDGVLDSQVPHPTLDDTKAEELGEFVERLHDGASATLIAIAPHGGDIELNTDRQAEHVATRLAALDASWWLCRGWKDNDRAFESWHVTSDDTDPRSFPLLASVASRGFAHAVSFHGFSEPIVLVGGLAPKELRQEIARAIDSATGPDVVVQVAGPDDPFNGDSPDNIVNRLTKGGANGVQIEQGLDVRKEHWAEIAEAVARVYETHLRHAYPSWVDRARSVLARARHLLRRLTRNEERLP